MRWTPGGVSSDLEDRRGSGGFGFGRGPTIGCGGAIILIVLSLLTGRNFFSGLGGGGGGSVQPQQQAPADPNTTVQQTPEESKEVEFVSFVLDDTQNTWARIFQENGSQYQR